MKALVLGASGATGQLVVMQLLKHGIQARIVFRESAAVPDEILRNSQVEIVKGNITEFAGDKLKDLLCDSDAIICCLGHNLTLRGIYGQPRRLVYDTVFNVVEVILKEGLPKKKLILMSTTGFTNKKNNENNTLGEKIVLALAGLLLPPQSDNLCAANFLIEKVGNNHRVEWVAVRPDTLINEEKESEYEVFPSPKRSPIFDSGKTSRMNVSQFMADLLSNESLWQKWKFETPVIYKKEV